MSSKITKILTALSALFISVQIISGSANSQYATLPFKSKTAPTESAVTSKNNTGRLQSTPAHEFSEAEKEILQRIESIKLSGNGTGEQILELQRELESRSGYSSTIKEEESFCRMILPNSNGAVPHTTEIFVGAYLPASSVQVEQRGSTAGRIWVAVGVAGLDTGVNASPDTLIMFYSDNGGDSYSEYVRAVFSAANKINFDDLDMEIIENTSGEKYIYLVFGYTTNGYFGLNRIGYTVIRTPTPGVFGSTLSFPGQTSSSRYFNPRITSDNARYAPIPYAFITVMQDSVNGSEHYVMTKLCYALSPYNLSPSITYLSRSIYTAVEGFVNFSPAADIAQFHNSADSIYIVLSEYPGFQSALYCYKGYSNSVNYPASDAVLSPSGNDLSYARVASNGGTNQKKTMIVYSDNYANSGDWDQYVMYSENRVNWSTDVLEYNSFVSGQGNIMGRRNADGSFAIAFNNNIGSLTNVVYTTYTGNFSQSNYIHRANPDYANGIASPKPAFRYTAGDSCLNVWSYFYDLNSTSECSAVGLYLQYAVEGYFDENTVTHIITDALYVYLADENPPHNYVDTAIVYLDNNLLLNHAAFYGAPPGDYYIVLKHFNALETWSAAPVYVGPLDSYSYTHSYEFMSSQAQAFGSNMTPKGSYWCLYSGDVNQDGSIDGTDLQEIDNDAYNFIYGILLNTDLNGDGFVDGGDYVLADNNAINFVSVMRP